MLQDGMYLTIASIDDLSRFRESFFWPVPDAEKEELMCDIERVCRTLYIKKQNKRRELLLRVFLPFLAMQSFNVGYAGMVVHALRRHGISPSNFQPSPIDFFSWLLQHGSLDHDLVESYICRYANPRHWLLNGWKGLLPSAEARLLTVNVTVEKFLKREGIQFSREYLPVWFTPLSLRHAPLEDTVFAQEIFDTLWSAIGSKVQLEEVQDWLKKFIITSVACIETQFNVLSKHAQSRKVKTLYTATQGNILTRLISLMVLEQGGRVLAFPHTGGFMYTLPQTWMIESMTASQFYCYTDMERSLRQKQTEGLYGKIPAQFKILPSLSRQGDRRVIASKKIKSVLFLSGSYLGDRNYMNVLPEPVRFDLELKIIGALLAQGVEVLVKLHRKSKVMKHQKMLLDCYFQSRVTIDDTPLTELLKSSIAVDAFVSENISGGSLTEVIKTDKPVILFTPYSHLIPPERLSQFHKRVYIVPCTFDEKNRAIFSEDQLQDILNRDRHEIDYTYVQEMTNPLFEY